MHVIVYIKVFVTLFYVVLFSTPFLHLQYFMIEVMIVNGEKKKKLWLKKKNHKNSFMSNKIKI